MAEHFIKQYAERRTGSNLLRVLLNKYFSDVVVLIHILGDKHEVPVDYNKLQGIYLSESSYYEKLAQLTVQRPAETTDLQNEEQQAYLHSIAMPLGNALKGDRLLYFISIKNPFAWAASMLKAAGWIGSKDQLKKNEVKYTAFLTDACRNFNRKYKAWFSLADQWPHQTTIIRYEDLLFNAEQIMLNIFSLYGFKKMDGQKGSIEEIVSPTHWDNLKTKTHFEKFNKSFYQNQEYLKLLTTTMIKIIYDTIDWNLLSRVEYSKTDYLGKERL